MSKSYRKTPIVGVTTAASDRYGKKASARKLRRAVKVSVARGDDVQPHQYELFDPYSMPKDGKTYIARGNPDAKKLMRK